MTHSHYGVNELLAERALLSEKLADALIARGNADRYAKEMRALLRIIVGESRKSVLPSFWRPLHDRASALLKEMDQGPS